MPDFICRHRYVSRDKEADSAVVFPAFQVVLVGAGAVGEVRQAFIVKRAGNLAHVTRRHAVQVDVDERAPDDSVVAAHLINGSRDVVLLFLLPIVLFLGFAAGELNPKARLFDVVHHLCDELGPGDIVVFGATFLCIVADGEDNIIHAGSLK